MRASTAAFDTMVNGRDQVIAYTVTIDLPGGSQYDDATLTVDKFEIDMQTVTDSADGTRLLTGYTAATAELTLSGRVDPNDETKTVAWLLGRYPKLAADGSISPLYRQDLAGRSVVVTAGLYPDGTGATPEVFEQFVGQVDSYDETPDGTITVSCIDLRSSLRGTVDVPAVITAAPYNAGLTSEFMFDAILRAATGGAISTWPAPRARRALAVGFRASLQPEVGSFYLDSTNPIPTFAPCGAASGLQALDTSATPFRSLFYLPAVNITTSAFVQFLVQGVGTGNPAPGVKYGDLTRTTFGGVPRYALAGVAIAVTSTGITVTDDGGSGYTWTTAVSADPHLVEVNLQISADGSTMNGTIRLDGAVQAFSYATPYPIFSAIVSVAPVAAGIGGAPASTATIGGLQITTETAPATAYPFTPGAVLDPSLNPLQVAPAVTGDPHQAMQQLAAGELGVAGFFGGRVFRFLNRNTIRSTPAARKITSDGGLVSLTVSSNLASIVNRARVGYTPWNVATHRSTVYSLASVLRVPAGASTTVTAVLSSIAGAIDTSAAVMPDGTTDPTQSWFRVSVDAAGTARHPGPVVVAFTQITSTQVTLVITNRSSRDAWLVSSADYLDMPAGTPLLTIAGVAAAQADELIIDTQFPRAADGGAASSQYGEHSTDVTGNPIIQDAGAAGDLGEAIVEAGCIAIPDFTNVLAVPDPRSEITDVVHLVDTARTGVDEYARLFGMTLTYDASGPSYEQALDARAIAAPGGWIGEVTGRTEGDVTTYGY